MFLRSLKRGQRLVQNSWIVAAGRGGLLEDVAGTSNRCADNFSSFRKEPEPKRDVWEALNKQGVKVNPCNSPLHPAVKSGAVGVDPNAPPLSVQEAYVSNSKCFGCGPSASKEGLHLRSYRIPGGLEGRVKLDGKFAAFPGIISGGVVSTLFDCHGNWTAAISLMDKACLPRPALTLTANLTLQYLKPTPPDTPLVVRSKILSIREKGPVGAVRTSVEIELNLYAIGPDGAESHTATGVGLFKKMGALRAL